MKRTPYQPYGSGVYRRQLTARRLDDAHVEGELIDDFHHFRARIQHDDLRVRAIEGEAPRHPWATCPGAIAALQGLVGMPLAGAGSMRATARHTDKREHCTHLLDAASIAVAITARTSTARSITARASIAGGGGIFRGWLFCQLASPWRCLSSIPAPHPQTLTGVARLHKQPR